MSEEKRWSEMTTLEKTLAIEPLWNEGLSGREIAKMLHTSRSAILGHRTRHSIGEDRISNNKIPVSRKRSWSEEQRQAFIILWNSGTPVHDIARELHIGRNTVTNRAHDLRCRGYHIRDRVTGKKFSRTRRRLGHFMVPAANESRRGVPVKIRKPTGSMLFIDTNRDQCRFIADDPKAQPIEMLQCCGEKVIAGTSWCAYHKQIVFSLPKAGHESRLAID